MLAQAFAAVGALVATASVSKKPDASVLPELFKSLSELLMKVTDIKDRNRPSPLFNYLSAVADGAPALGWVSIVGVAT